jgi:ABC-type Fe3+ transport system permease subunit
MTALSIPAPIAFPLLPVNRIRSGAAGLLQVLSNPTEWKSAATVAGIVFVVSLVLAPALTRDHTQLASEINAKTLKAAAALKASPRLAVLDQQ